MPKAGSIPSPELDIEECEARQPSVGPDETSRRREHVRQVAAISAFEGHTPSPEYRRIRDLYESGRITIDEMKSKVLELCRTDG